MMAFGRKVSKLALQILFVVFYNNLGKFFKTAALVTAGIQYTLLWLHF